MKRLLLVPLIVTLQACGSTSEATVVSNLWATRQVLDNTSGTATSAAVYAEAVQFEATETATIATMVAPYLPKPGELPSSKPIEVAYVVDGDGLVGTDGIEYRLAGIDAPEYPTTVPTQVGLMGMVAESVLEDEVANCPGYLDVEYGEKARIDKYGRTLVYLWCDRTNLLINEDLVRQGVARERFYGDNSKYRDRYLAAQAEAKARGHSIWTNGQLCGLPDCIWRGE